MKGNVRESWILDFTLWIPDLRYWIREGILVSELGFQIPIVRGIADSLSWIPDSKAQDFWLHKSWTQNTLKPKTEFTRRRAVAPSTLHARDSGFRNRWNFCLWTEILDFGIQNTAQGIWNTRTNVGNPESKFHWQRVRNPVTWIKVCLRFPLHVATILAIFIWEFPAILGDIFVMLTRPEQRECGPRSYSHRTSFNENWGAFHSAQNSGNFG